MSVHLESRPTVAPPRKLRVRAPRIWLGCEFNSWLRLLTKNRFDIHWSLWGIVAIDTLSSLVNTTLGWSQELIYGRQVAQTQVREAPLFIIGHWRSGTTFLHEMLTLDQNHTYPTTYETFAPNHFLLTERWIPYLLWFLMPQRRPMDNMPTGWDRPQEDEFALCMMGLPSPYLTCAFPNRPPQYSEYFDLDRLTPEALETWKTGFYRFIQRLTYKNPKRLILKSPPHTCRIGTLLELFPDARFVHLVRDPYVVFPSTMQLWKSLYKAHGLQRPTFEGLEEYVFKTYRHFHERMENSRQLIHPNRLHEVRYEDLVRDPVNQIQTLYDRLELKGFDDVLPALENYLSSVRDYETNHYELTPEDRAAITRRWGDIIRQYGYPEQE